MQTKGLAGFCCNDTELKLIYQHNNAAPENLGVKLLQEVKAQTSEHDLDHLYDRIDHMLPVEEGAPISENGYLKKNIRRHFSPDMLNAQAVDAYELFEPFQGSLKPYLEGTLQYFPNGADFLHDAKFCDWAYVVDMDKEQFDVLRGRRENEFDAKAYGQGELSQDYGNTLYYMGLVKSYALKDLPTDEQFITDLKPYHPAEK